MKGMIDFLDYKKFQPIFFRKPFSLEYKMAFEVYLVTIIFCVGLSNLLQMTTSCNRTPNFKVYVMNLAFIG